MLVIADVAVTVKDARAAAAWWKDKVGFEVHTIGPPGGHALMVAPPGERFLLHLCEGFEGVEPGNTGIAFVTDDLEGHVRRMCEAGVTFTEPLSNTEWGGSAKFEDPDGNIFWMLGAPTSFIREQTRKRARPERSMRMSSTSGQRRTARSRAPTRPRRTLRGRKVR